MKPTFTTRGSNGGSGPSTSRAATPMNARFLRPTPRTRQSADGPKAAVRRLRSEPRVSALVSEDIQNIRPFQSAS